MKIRLRTNIILQILMTILQVYNQAGETLPEEWKPVVMFIITIIQAIIALLSHYSNPDGTPVKIAYIKPIKKIDIR